MNFTNVGVSSVAQKNLYSESADLVRLPSLGAEDLLGLIEVKLIDL